jgi:hypothetical protein
MLCKKKKRKERKKKSPGNGSEQIWSSSDRLARVYLASLELEPSQALCLTSRVRAGILKPGSFNIPPKQVKFGQGRARLARLDYRIYLRVKYLINPIWKLYFFLLGFLLEFEK